MQALTAASLAALSDVLAQLLTSPKYQWRRTAAFALYGLLWSGPANHCWQALLQKIFKGRNDHITIVQKVISLLHALKLSFPDTAGVDDANKAKL